VLGCRSRCIGVEKSSKVGGVDLSILIFDFLIRKSNVEIVLASSRYGGQSRAQRCSRHLEPEGGLIEGTSVGVGDRIAVVGSSTGWKR
jgi:hypothetical protein